MASFFYVENSQMDQKPRPFSRCWGIGLGRTGTTSLCQAYSILGYRNVLHNPSFEELRTADAGADNGVTIFYKYLDYIYPGSKFVLSIRDLESWLESMQYAASAFPVKSLGDHTHIMRRMLIYETIRFDRKKFADAYARHYDHVQHYFRDRPEDLLEINIVAGEGWEKLCPFLEVPIPPVSSLNDSGAPLIWTWQPTLREPVRDWSSEWPVTRY